MTLPLPLPLVGLISESMKINPSMMALMVRADGTCDVCRRCRQAGMDPDRIIRLSTLAAATALPAASRL